MRAASLTHTSLPALVPLLAISFATLSAFDDMQIKVQAHISGNVVLQVGKTVSQYLGGFTKQTAKLTAVGIVFLVAISVVLLLAISNSLGAIWRAAR